MKKKIISLLCFLSALSCFSQEVPFFSNKQLQYAYHNPAYIPELQYATILMGGRFQWTGLEGAPMDAFLSAKYFFLGAHSQLGINILYDKIGYQYVVNPKVNYTFCIPFADDSYINLGIGAGMMSKGYDDKQIYLGKKADGRIENLVYDELEKGSAPDVDAGIEILIQNFEMGFAASHLLKGTDNVTMNRTFYGFANYNFQSSEWWRLSPTYAFYYFVGDEGSEDVCKNQIGLDFYYIGDYDSHPADLFYVGAFFRIPREAGVRAGFSWGIFSLFYSYDFFFGDLRYDSYGSHELGMEFKIPQKNRGCFANYGKSRKKYTRYHRL